VRYLSHWGQACSETRKAHSARRKANSKKGDILLFPAINNHKQNTLNRRFTQIIADDKFFTAKRIEHSAKRKKQRAESVGQGTFRTTDH